MLSQQDIHQIRALYIGGYNLRQIADKTGFSRNTVRRYIRSDDNLLHQSALTPYTEWIRQAFYDAGGKCTEVHRRLSEEKGIYVHERTLRRFCSIFRDDYRRIREFERRRRREIAEKIPTQGRSLTRSQIEHIGELSQRGYSVNVIARKTGHCRTTVRKYLFEHGYVERDQINWADYRDWILTWTLKVNGNFAELHRLFEATFNVQVNERTFRRRSIQFREESILEDQRRLREERERALAQKQGQQGTP